MQRSKLAQGGLLACGIGLPIAPVDGDINGLRLGVPEIVRLGFAPSMPPSLGLDRAGSGRRCGRRGR